MSDEKPAEESTPQTASSPKKPPVALVVAGLAVTTLIIGVALLRGRAPSPSDSLPPSAPVVESDAGPDDPDVEPPPESVEAANAGGPQVLALFAPLRPGSPIGRGRIERITEVTDGRVMVEVRIDAQRANFGVMLRSADAAGLPQAGPFVVYVHGAPQPAFTGVEMLLAARIRANAASDAGLAAPAGMRAFFRDQR